MKIYTKNGDSGETALYGGTRVGKDTPRTEVIGTSACFSSHPFGIETL